jgi:RecJ-like exonuclease
MAREVLMVEDQHGERVEIPAKYALCDTCEGSGMMENPAFSNGFTSSEWAEMDADSRDTYMQGGYDVPCDCCGGKRVVLVVDEQRLTFGHRRALVFKRQMDRAAREVRAEAAAERRAFGYC